VRYTLLASSRSFAERRLSIIEPAYQRDENSGLLL
jgi:hypothetical protein